MELSVAITTAPRPIPTLSESLLSLRRAGFQEPVTIIADQIAPELEEEHLGPFRVLPTEQRLGSLGTFWRALEELLRLPAAWLLVLEDDIEWSLGSRAALDRAGETLKTPHNLGFVSLYVHRSMASRLTARYGPRALRRQVAQAREVYYEISAGYRTMGSQALLLPRRAAERLVTEADRSWHRDRNRDQVAGGRVQELGLTTWWRVPGLVNHRLGSSNSSLKVKSAQDTRYWRKRA